MLVTGVGAVTSVKNLPMDLPKEEIGELASADTTKAYESECDASRYGQRSQGLYGTALSR